MAAKNRGQTTISAPMYIGGLTPISLEVKSGSASKTSYQEFTDYFVNEFGAQGKGRLNGQVIESATTVYVP